MTKEFIYNFIVQYNLTVVATTTGSGAPSAALIGYAVTPDLEIIFDTVNTSRKYANLMQDPRISLVIGWENEATVQYEGIAEVLVGPGAEKNKEI